ncbi:hypothetical protein BDZ89DRAFT_941223 [Hymenopellis radicata]|nr:hypothetical protein BDZ89DRAFT_941223 [Hymenopellis radicata]
MMFKLSNIFIAAAAAMLIFTGRASAVADNDVDACNGSNDYDVGHDCAFQQSQGSKSCQTNSCGVLICVPN